MIAPWIIIGGLSDLYLTCMVWFIFDKNKSVSVFKDDHRTYSIVDVVKSRFSASISYIESEESED